MFNPLSTLWVGHATIYEYQDITDPETFQTKHELVPVVIDEPCRLSYNHEQSTNIQDGAAVVSQSITLFIRPGLQIKAGSVIDVTQHGVTTRFKRSGKPAVYSQHQQIVLEIDEDNA